MATSDAQMRASKKWQDANTDRLSVIAPRGAKAAIKAAAAAAGESVNAYIIRAVNTRMASEGTPAPHPAPPAAEQPPKKSPASPAPSLADLMSIRDQKLADKLQQEQLEHPGQVRPAEQPPKPSLLPPTRDLDTSNVPPDLAAAMERAASAQAEMHARQNSAEKNSPASGTNAEQR